MSAQVDDELASNCRRHGGTAYVINCWECYAEAKEDDYYDYDRDDEEDEDED